jgi:hypothetical protein
MNLDDFRDFDEDGIIFYHPDYIYEQDTEDFPLECPYRQMPPSAPPNFTPSQPQSQQISTNPLVINPGAIRPCLHRFVYIWPRRGNGFWTWITFVGLRSISGFRWTGNTWRYFRMNLRDIRSFLCF